MMIEKSTLQPDTPLEDLSLPEEIKEHLKALGYANLEELAWASPERLRWPGSGQDELRQIATLLEDYILSLESSELLPFYGNSLPDWRPFLSQADLIRQVMVRSLIPMTSIHRAFPRSDQPPPSGLRIPVRNLNVSVRASHCLKISGIANVHELALASPKLLLHIRNVGIITLGELAAVVEEYLRSLESRVRAIYKESYQLWKPLLEGQPPLPEVARIRVPELHLDSPIEISLSNVEIYGRPEPEPEPATPPLVTELMAAFLSQQNEGDRSIFLKRFALRRDSSPESLGAIAQSSGSTRQSVRKITLKLQQTLAAMVRRSHPTLLHPLRAHVDQVTVATLDELVSMLPSTGERAEFEWGSCVALLISSSPDFHSIDPAGQLWTSSPSLDIVFYRRVIKAAKAVVRRGPIDLPNLAIETAKNLGCNEQEADAVRVIIHHAPSIFSVEPASQKVLRVEVDGLKTGRAAFAYAFIQKRGVPTTVFEIFDAMEKKEPDILPRQSARHAAIHSLRPLLEHDERFAWAGLSAYGLREWGYEPGVTSIGQALVSLLRKKGPLTIPKIQKALARLYQVSPDSLVAALLAQKGKTITRDSAGRWKALP
jgi:hypothetical protein